MKRIGTIVMIVAIFLPLSFFAYAGDADGSIVAMSYNIRNSVSKDGTNSWEYRYPATALMIDDQKPDVIGIQEAVSSTQIEYLKYSFEKVYKIIGAGSEDGKKKGEVSAIMYNVKTLSPVKSGTFWISETPDVPSKGWDATDYQTATWAIFKDKATGSRFLFITAKLDSEGVLSRQEGVKMIVEQLKGINTDSLPVIMAADFNVEPGGKEFIPLKPEYSDARTSAVITDEIESFNGWGKMKKTVDYLWYKGFSCTKFETITKAYYERNFISDHYPVKAVFVF